MFHVCWSCGSFRPDKQIDLVRSVASCPECGAAHPLGGLLLLVGARAVIVMIAQLSPSVLYATGLALGIGQIALGLWMPLTPQVAELARHPRSLHPFHTFLLGAVVMVNELTTALPYFIAIERLASAGVAGLEAVDEKLTTI